MIKADVTLIRFAGKGRFFVRSMVRSCSISINWLNAAEPNAAAAVPIKVWNKSHQSIIPHLNPPARDFDANIKPKRVVIRTNTFKRTFVSTIRSWRMETDSDFSSNLVGCSLIAAALCTWTYFCQDRTFYKIRLFFVNNSLITQSF